MTKLIAAQQPDLPLIASLHKKVYSKSHFTSRFSDKLLKKYYECFFREQCFVIKSLVNGADPNEINGFIVCGVGIPEQIKLFKKHNRTLIYLTIFFNPMAALRKVIGQIYHQFFDFAIPFSQAPFLILSIASDRSISGIGLSLLTYSKNLSRSLGFNAIGLYVRVNNIKAVNFYIRNGFSIKGYKSGQFYLEADTE